MSQMRKPRALLAEPGVYMIRCLLDKRAYVGSSKDIKRRLQRHVCALRGGTHHSVHLQRAWDKYGEDAFEVFALGYYPLESLREEEQWWLDNTKAVFNGSRIAYRVEHSAEVRAKISAKVRAKCQDPAHIAKLSLAQKGKVGTNKGEKLSEATVATLRAASWRKNRVHEAFGRLWCLKELAFEYGVHYGMLRDRVRAGWPVEDAVLRPKRTGGL